DQSRHATRPGIAEGTSAAGASARRLRYRSKLPYVSTASSILGYAPQRQRLPAMPCRTSSRVGSGSASTSAAAETIWPGVQNPHWSASARTKASTSGWSRRPSIVVTSRSPTVWTSVMHESTGTPSSCTVQAPQWPSAHATFVPVRPRSPRRVSASVWPTGASTRYTPPFTRSSHATCHRKDVREVDEPKRRPAHKPLLAFVFDLGQRAPEVARGLQELPDPLSLFPVPVPVGGRVEREPEHADRVCLPSPEQRRRHRQVLVAARKGHRL